MAKRKPAYEAKRRRVPQGSGQTSSVYERGQTVIPKAVREALAIEYGAKLRWEVREGAIRVVPVPTNPVRALRGVLNGTGLTFQQFMAQRQTERLRERKLEERDERRWRTSSTRRR